MKKLAVLALALTAATALAAPVFAGDDDDGRRAQRGSWIGVDTIHQKLTDLGYTRITDIERDDGRYEVDATSPEGRRVELVLHRSTGEILRTDRDDDDDDDRYDD